MNINNEIKEILKKFKIREEEGLCYLLCLYYNIFPTFLPLELTKKMLITNIFIYEKNNLKWNISLFNEQIIDLDWIKKEYIPLFTSLGKKPYVRECEERMIKFLKIYSDIKKDEIIEATKLYIRETDIKFIRQPHYFINKGVGTQLISDLYQYVNILRLNNTPTNFIGHKLQ